MIERTWGVFISIIVAAIVMQQAANSVQYDHPQQARQMAGAPALVHGLNEVAFLCLVCAE